MLPAAVGDGADGIFLEREDASADTPTRLRIEHFSRAADRNELLSDMIRPGRYLVANYRPELTEPFAALGTLHADVKPGEQTVVDLRGLKAANRLVPVSRPKSWNTVVAKHEDQVVSGAEVTVYASVARREDLARWLQEWESDDVAVRKSAITMLKRAGAVAVDAIRAAGEGLSRDEVLEELGDLNSDGLYRLADDLSDGAGTVRCEIEDGRDCVAVARVRGRLIGWHAFIASGETVTVELRPTRTLLIRPKRKDLKSEWGYEYGHIRMDGPADTGTRGLMSALVHASGSQEYGGWIRREAVFDNQYPLPTDGKATWVMEDLPVESVWTVTLLELPTEEGNPQRPKSARVTIEAGSSVQTVQW